MKLIPGINVIGTWVVGFSACFLSQMASGTFTRVQMEFFNANPGFFYNLAWGDYNNDGNVDFVATNGLDFAHFLFKNNGDGSFTRAMDTVIEDDNPTAGGNAIWGDFDNDGDLDLFISNFDAGGEIYNRFPEIYGGMTNVNRDFYYRNEGDGTFTKIMEGELVNSQSDAYGSMSAGFDYDNDGYLDLFVGSSYDTPNYLFHNNGDGMMTNVGGATTIGMWEAHGSTTVDYDGDGHADLIIAGQEFMQFHNEGNGSFSVGPLMKGVGADWGVAAGDFDNDGDMDLVTAGDTNRYYNNNNGVYEELTTTGVSFDDYVESVGVWPGDYDNDGYLDLYYTNHLGMNNFLFHNNGDGTFSQILSEAFVMDGGFGWAASWADYDNDGDLDIIVGDSTLWPFVAGPYPIRLFRNDGNSNNWVSFTLEGTESNRSAIGAKVRIRANTDGKELNQMREIVTSLGCGSQTDLRVHFGLGDASIIDGMQIEWPSGIVQEFHNVAVNRFYQIVEGEQWAWYPYENASKDVNTGQWMGMLNVAHEPWIWCEQTGCWYYFDEQVALDHKGWMYAPDKDALVMIPVSITNLFWSYELECWLYAPDSQNPGWVYRIDSDGI